MDGLVWISQVLITSEYISIYIISNRLKPHKVSFEKNIKAHFQIHHLSEHIYFSTQRFFLVHVCCHKCYFWKKICQHNCFIVVKIGEIHVFFHNEFCLKWWPTRFWTCFMMCWQLIETLYHNFLVWHHIYITWQRLKNMVRGEKLSGRRQMCSDKNSELCINLYFDLLQTWKASELSLHVYDVLAAFKMRFSH